MDGLRRVPAGDLARLARHLGLHPVHRPDLRAHAVRPAHPHLLPSPAAVGRLLRQGDGRPDHDPDDHRRRSAVTAAAERFDQRRGQHLQLRRRDDRAGLHAAPADAGHARRGAAVDRRDPVVPQQLGQGLRPGPRPHRRGQRQSPGELVRRAGGPGVCPGGPEPALVPHGRGRVPRRPARRSEAGRHLLPVRAAAGLGGRRHRARRRCPAGGGGGDDGGRGDRLPALPRPVLLAHPAALPGLRHLAAGPGVDAADQRAHEHTDRHPAVRFAGPGRAGAGPNRFRGGALRLSRFAVRSVAGRRSGDRAGRDRRPGR